MTVAELREFLKSLPAELDGYRVTYWNGENSGNVDATDYTVDHKHREIEFDYVA
ncbi:hypothetical protein [Streptomyces sp. IBSNAI001]|uniref:hypothetical protein n=1 Tax=Streptomyces sp. IBSNAI001 TaxID=3457499 RepID=UPI003FCFBC3D